MDITPARFPTPPDRPVVTAQLRAHRHGILTAAEIVAGIRELLRDEGDAYAGLVETLKRIEPHLTWTLQQLDQVASQLAALGWQPPPIPPPERTGYQ